MVYRRMQTGGLRIWRDGSGELGVHSWKRGCAVLRTRLISHLEIIARAGVIGDPGPGGLKPVKYLDRHAR